MKFCTSGLHYPDTHPGGIPTVHLLGLKSPATGVPHGKIPDRCGLGFVKGLQSYSTFCLRSAVMLQVTTV